MIINITTQHNYITDGSTGMATITSWTDHLKEHEKSSIQFWTAYITLTYLVFLLKQKLQCIVTLNIQETCHFLIILEELTVQECRLWLSHYLKNYSIENKPFQGIPVKKTKRIKIDIKDCNESLYLWNTTAMSIHLLNKVVCRGNQELIKGPQKKRHFSNHKCVTAQKNYIK